VLPVPAEATAAPTAEGRIEWDTDNDLLVLGTSAGTKIQVNTDSTQTLTNKTLGTGSVWNGGTIAASYIATLNQNTTGNAATATTLATARTINGVSFNGSANVTITANTPQALTFNNGGAGVASGTTFNGSTARTISYNSVGAPSTTGTGASGTWAINISGTAAVATTASAVNTASTITSTARVGMSVVSSSNDSMYELVKPTVVGYALAITSDNRLAMVQTNGAGDWFKTLLSVDTSGNTTAAGTLNVVGDVTTSGSVTASGNVTAYSDETLKTNWRDLDADFVAQLASVKMGIYDRIDTGATQVGVSAQSLQSVLTHAVQNTDGVLSVAYGNAALASCVALAREVINLKAELAALKG
jgi:hypothetical protein